MRKLLPAGCGALCLALLTPTLPAQSAVQAATQAATPPASHPAAPAPAGPAAVTLWKAGDLSTQAKALLAEAAAGKGSAGTTLTRFPTQYTMLTTRIASGGAELHKLWSDYLIILAGEGVELTGGTIVGRQEGAGGEVRGTRLEGAVSHPLHAGDILFIPAGTPHQAIEAPGQTLSVFVIKAAGSTEVQPLK